MKFTDAHLEAFSKAHTDLVHNSLRNLNGESERDRHMSARWSNEEFADDHEDIDLAAEIAAAIYHETIAEITQNVYYRARLHRPAASFDFSNFSFFGMEHDTLPGEVIDTLEKLAKQLGDGTMLILSPTMLTVIQGAGELKRFEHVRSVMDGLPVGTCRGIPVIIDPFGTDAASIIVAAPGWFQFNPAAEITAKFNDAGTGLVKGNFRPIIVAEKMKIVDISWKLYTVSF